MVVSMAPLRLGGLRGKKSTPSVGWEVPVRSQQLASRSWTERKCGTITFSSSHLATVHMCTFCIEK
jgi:hypothetical protein